MRKFYSRTAVVALSAYLFLWLSPAHAQSNYRFGQTLQQLQQEQQIDQFRREQEQDQLQQLNEIPGQPATGMRQLQLKIRNCNWTSSSSSSSKTSFDKNSNSISSGKKSNSTNRRAGRCPISSNVSNSFRNFSSNDRSINYASNRRVSVVDDNKSGFANFLGMRKTTVDRGIFVEKKDSRGFETIPTPIFVVSK